MRDLNYDYDKQIEMLLNSDHFYQDVYVEWAGCRGLFRYLNQELPNAASAGGCLTMVKGSFCTVASGNPEFDSWFERVIKKDPEIPVNSEDITKKSLPVFKKYQQLFDEFLRSGQMPAEAISIPQLQPQY